MSRLTLDELRQIVVEQLGVVSGKLWDSVLAAAANTSRGTSAKSILKAFAKRMISVGGGQRPAISEYQARRILNLTDRGKSLLLNRGRYLLLHQPPHWSGGGGTVHLAIERVSGQDDRLVALKRVETADPTTIDGKRLAREIDLLCDVKRRNHPHSKHVVQGYNAFAEGTSTWVSMEYRQGVTLQELVDGLAQKGNRLSVRQALLLVDSAANGLEFLHTNGCVHRDIKPKNLIYDRNYAGSNHYFVCVVDLGIVKVINDPITHNSTLVGTPYYMAPECCGKADTADMRTDIYGLAASLYFMLVGEPPAFAMFLKGNPLRWPDYVKKDIKEWGATSPQWSRTALNEIRPEVPSMLSELVFRCLDPNPANRASNLTEFRNDYAPVLHAAEKIRGLQKRFPGFRNGLLQSIRAVIEEVDKRVYPVEQNAKAFEKEVVLQLSRLETEFCVDEVVPQAKQYNTHLMKLTNTLRHKINSTINAIVSERGNDHRQLVAFEQGLEQIRQLQPQVLALQHKFSSNFSGFV